MGILRWGEPFDELRRLHREMDRIFQEVFGSGRGLLPITGAPSAAIEPLERLTPAVDLYETEKEIVLKADLPGLQKEEVEVSATEDSITIKGELKREEEVKEEGYYRRERRYGTFTRTIPMPVAVEAEKATASFKNGILEVRIPKIEEKLPKARRIEIK